MNASIVEAIKQRAQGQFLKIQLQRAFHRFPLHISKELHPANLSIHVPQFAWDYQYK